MQEALSNVRKHAHAHVVRVSLQTLSGRLHLRVEDDGQGFVPSDTSASPVLHLGLEAMCERVRASGGDINVESSPNRGTRVDVVIPL